MVRILLAPLLLAACAAAPAPAPPASPPMLPSAERDYDKDGFVDPRDRCPRDPGEAPVGCPDKDFDGDGLKAAVDKCPEVAGPAPDGCPLPDADNDGVANDVDRCQGKFETLNGFEDRDGCADEIPKDLAKFTGPIKGVVFETTGDALKASSKPVLDRAADVLKKYPDVRIEISGHIDNTMKVTPENEPSARRAEVVKQYLVARGVEASRLETRGAGANEPLDSNRTASGRARNRRIEFTLLVQ